VTAYRLVFCPLAESALVVTRHIMCVLRVCNKYANAEHAAEAIRDE